jgi:DNA-binding CsgD family transcriptional regulator
LDGGSSVARSCGLELFLRVDDNRLMAEGAGSLVGREAELEAIVRWIERPLSQVLVLEGDPGIGKTTLWRGACAEALRRGRHVCSCNPAEAEMQLAFSVLRDLLDPRYEEFGGALAAPQRRALDVALLRAEPARDDPAHDRGRVAAATLGLLRAASRECDLVLALDDAQWLDRASEAAFAFALRRVRGEPVAVLMTLRTPTELPLGLGRAPPDAVDRCVIGPLSVGALQRLVQAHLGFTFPRPKLLRLHELSAGNPFYALELARSLQRRGDGLGTPPELPGRLEGLVRERIASLPRRTLEVLQVAAALSRPTEAVLARAVGGELEPLEPALDAGIVELADGRVVFTHPLLASAAYASLSPLRRRKLHRRLASLVDEPEQEAWHLALATSDANDAIAETIARAGEHARARGAPAAAAELADHALRLTRRETTGERLRRLHAAAAYAFEAGDAERARVRFVEAVALAPSGEPRAEALTRLARVHAFDDDLRRAVDLYREALGHANAAPRVRAEAEEGMAVALMRMLKDLPQALDHAHRAVKLVERCGDMQALSEYVATAALIEALMGRETAVEGMRRARTLDRGAPSGHASAEFLRGLWGGRFMPAVVLSFTDDHSRAYAALESARVEALNRGDESSLPLLLRYLSYTKLLGGSFPEAARLAVDGYELALGTGQRSQQAVLAATRALVDAHLGRDQEGLAEAEEALQLAELTASGFARLLADWALGLLDLANDNAAEAGRRLASLARDLATAGVREPGLVRFVPDAVEALLATDRRADAGPLLEAFEADAVRLRRLSAQATAARCRGLILADEGNVDAARNLLQRALVAHERSPVPFEHARTLLALGRIERRAKRRAAAREALDAAVSRFEALGAASWAAKARSERARIGGRSPSARELTPTEQRVAALVVEGRSTKEVAAALFVSPKTVDGHLSKIYAKLDVHSRTELAHRLSAAALASR